jgi:transcriptional regulator with XRE-family HTH domain
MHMTTLREWRIRRLLSMRELAERANVAQRTLVEAELGRQVPHPKTMRKLAEALDVDPMDVDEFRTAIDVALKAAEEKVAA